MIQHLRDLVHAKRLHPAIEAVRSSHDRNREIAEQFKATLYEGRIHSPFDQLAQDELLFLRDDGYRVDHPTTGPCTTKDVADALMEVTMALNGLQYDPVYRFRATGPRGHPGPRPMSDEETFARMGNPWGSPRTQYSRLAGDKTTPLPGRRRRRRG
jgi:hypothetical protein